MVGGTGEFGLGADLAACGSVVELALLLIFVFAFHVEAFVRLAEYISRNVTHHIRQIFNLVRDIIRSFQRDVRLILRHRQLICISPHETYFRIVLLTG